MSVFSVRVLSSYGGVRILNGGGHQRELILVGLQIGGAEGDELHIAVIGGGSKADMRGFCAVDAVLGHGTVVQDHVIARIDALLFHIVLEGINTNVQGLGVDDDLVILFGFKHHGGAVLAGFLGELGSLEFRGDKHLQIGAGHIGEAAIGLGGFILVFGPVDSMEGGGGKGGHGAQHQEQGYDYGNQLLHGFIPPISFMVPAHSPASEISLEHCCSSVAAPGSRP